MGLLSEQVLYASDCAVKAVPPKEVPFRFWDYNSYQPQLSHPLVRNDGSCSPNYLEGTRLRKAVIGSREVSIFYEARFLYKTF